MCVDRVLFLKHLIGFEAVDKILGQVLCWKGFWVKDGSGSQKDTQMLVQDKRQVLLVFLVQQGPNSGDLFGSFVGFLVFYMFVFFKIADTTYPQLQVKRLISKYRK